jgi:hypothetical protein
MPRDLKYGHVTIEHGDIGEDEPVVIFRAADKLLVPVLDMYADLCRRSHCTEHHLAAIGEARAFVSEWQMNEDNPVRLPASESYTLRGTGGRIG